MSYTIDIKRKTLGRYPAGATLAVGTPVALVNGRWVVAGGSVFPALGIVTVGAAVNAIPEVSYEAQISGYSGLVPGLPVYLSSVSGQITQTAPSLLQMLGVATSDSAIEFAVQTVTANTAASGNAVNVNAGQSVQAAIDAAVAKGASISNPFYLVADKLAVMDWTAPLPAGVNVIIANSNKYRIAPRIPYRTHLVSIILARGSKDYFAVPAGAEYGAGISAAAYCAIMGIPITHGVLGGHIGQSDSYGDVIPTMTANELRIANWVKGDSVVSGTKDASYGEDRLPENFADAVLMDKTRVEALSATVQGVTPPTGFAQPVVSLIETASELCVTPFDFTPLGLSCDGYSEGGFGTQPYGEPYHRPYDDSYTYTSGEVMEHNFGWYSVGLASTYDYGWKHGATAPNGNAGAQNNFAMYQPLKYQKTAEAPVTWEECGRTLFAAENVSTITHAAFKQIIDDLVTARANGLIDIVSLGTLIQGVREIGPSKPVIGESMTVTADVGLLRRRPVNVLAVHGSIGATSTVFRVVPAARTLVTGECKVNYTTGAITFFAADDPTGVTVDYVPEPAWGGLKQWNFADMPAGEIVLANEATDTRKYGFYEPAQGGVHGGVISGADAANKVLTLDAAALREIWFKPSVVPGKQFMLRVKASSADAATLKIRWWYSVTTLNADVPSTDEMYQVSIPQSIMMESPLKTVGATEAYYYFPIGIPAYVQALEMRLSAASGVAVVKSIEWAMC